MAKHRTMQGREIDMAKLAAVNELMPAVGNMKVNARGDELGPGGQIIRKREDIVSDYYEDNPNARPVIANETIITAPVEDKKSKIDPLGDE